MDIGIHILGRGKLDDEIDFGDIETSGSNVGSDQTLELTSSESLESDFSLLLGDITMKDLALLLDVGLQHDFVGLLLGFCEDNGSAMLTSVSQNYITNGAISTEVGAVNSQMSDGSGGLEILDEVDLLVVGSHVLLDDFVDPFGDSSREEQALKLLFVFNLVMSIFIYFFDVFAETHVQHLVGFIQNDTSKALEVQGLSLQKIEQSAWSSDDNFATILQIPNLLSDFSTTID